ncbi:MAG: hypothetical protein ACM3QX_10995 [Syntrophomonadaceae bacterium]
MEFAKIQNCKGISGTYYFRIMPESFSERIIKTIANLGHEIGYHYEDMDLTNGNIDLAYDSFRRNLDMLRKICPIETICMHGSPRSKYDNRDIWKKYNFRDLGIIGEPYFDLDFRNVLYLTDTGRKWNGTTVSVRDKVNSGFNFNFHTTFNLINSINLFPDKVMITFHPQRWTNNYYLWFKELLFQNIKNIIKRCFFVHNN